VTPAEARDQFSEAYDDELGPEARAAFDAALAADAELQADWARFREALDMARGALGAEDMRNDTNSSAGLSAAHVPNLLPGVQQRLRARSRGRYYANRYSERRKRGRLSPVYLLVTLAVALVSLWLALHFIETVQPALYPM
jgi:hypothetical protein